MIKNDIKYAAMRNELIDYLRELSGLSYQRSSWVVKDASEDMTKSELNYSVHFLYDDTNLSNNPYSCIGWFLRDQEEAKLILEVINSLDAVFEKYGLDLKDQEYIEKEEWTKVLESSKLALELLKSNGQLCFITDHGEVAFIAVHKTGGTQSATKKKRFTIMVDTTDIWHLFEEEKKIHQGILQNMEQAKKRLYLLKRSLI